ncbi:MAG: DUF4445 domain-containing protein [Candidatus Lokiarchaeota archaeon]|nr:DUF4445 domain-containing protein [Candidatus Lokiarchaeota archaeon]
MNTDYNNIIIDFEPISRRIEANSEQSIYDILLKVDINIRALCGGVGKCGKCKILIEDGKDLLAPLTDSEKELLQPSEIQNGWRLACQAKLKKVSIVNQTKSTPSRLRIFLPDDLLLEDFNILTTGVNKELDLNPAVKKLYLEVEEPTLENPLSDTERILKSLSSKTANQMSIKSLNFEHIVLQTIPDLLREKNHQITLTIIDEERVISVEPGDTSEKNFGIAFDIGTTTIVGYLINLNNGKIYSVSSMLNPQTAYGEDVITRITYIKNHKEGLKKLHASVIDALNSIIRKNCEKAKVDPANIYEATIVGNSVMHHIFLRFTPVYIGLSPYVPVIQQHLNIKALDLNLDINQSGNVYVLPIFAGFVGADTMGVIISSKIYEEKKLTLAIDIGTNGEIIVGNKDFLVVGSCAAGSALEGAHIADGMRAAAGSIDSVVIDPDTLEPSYTTIKNKKPIGICGSGLIDLIAEMLKAKIITRSGSFNKELVDHSRIVKFDKSYAYIVVNKDLTNIGKDILLSQNDIRQIQMAKAAFYSGSKIILNHIKDKGLIKNPKIEQVFLAGAFGNYINKINAKFVGMIPDILEENIYQIGNAAGIGAQNCLLNKNLRTFANKLVKKVDYVEIAVKKEFQRQYAEAMYFPHLKLEEFLSLINYESIPKR